MRQPLMLLCAATVAALLAAPPAAAVFIHEFDKGDEVLVKVNELTSIKTQIPYSALDNLPLTIPITRIDKTGFFYHHGHYIGVIGQYEEHRRYFIHNHLSFLVKYQRNLETGASRIVAFEIKPFSVKHQFEAQWNGLNTRLSTCNASANKFILSSGYPQEIKVGEEIIFTYDVNFEESEIKWASRWDAYLSTTDDQARWFSIVNSLVYPNEDSCFTPNGNFFID